VVSESISTNISFSIDVIVGQIHRRAHPDALEPALVHCFSFLSATSQITSSSGSGSHAAAGRKPSAVGHSHSSSFADISGRRYHPVRPPCACCTMQASRSRSLWYRSKAPCSSGVSCRPMSSANQSYATRRHRLQSDAAAPIVGTATGDAARMATTGHG